MESERRFSHWRTTGNNIGKKKVGNTIVQDKDTIQYQADITGYNLNNEDYPKLDSINIKTNKQYIYTNTIIEKPVIYKKKLITTSPSITAGYDPINKQWGIMIGWSVNLNIF